MANSRIHKIPRLFSSIAIGELLSYLFLDTEKKITENQAFSKIIAIYSGILNKYHPSILAGFQQQMPSILSWCLLLSLSKQVENSTYNYILDLGILKVRIALVNKDELNYRSSGSRLEKMMYGILIALGFDKSIIDIVCLYGIEVEIEATEDYFLEVLSNENLIANGEEFLRPSLHPGIGVIRPCKKNEYNENSQINYLLFPSTELILGTYFHIILETLIPVRYLINKYINIEDNLTQKFYILAADDSPTKEEMLSRLYNLISYATLPPNTPFTEKTLHSFLGIKDSASKNIFSKIIGFINLERQVYKAYPLKAYANEIRLANEEKQVENNLPIKNKHNILLHSLDNQTGKRIPLSWHDQSIELESSGNADITFIEKHFKIIDNLTMFRPHRINHCYHGGHLCNMIFAVRNDDTSTEIHEYLSPAYSLGEESLFERLARIIGLKYVRKDLTVSSLACKIICEDIEILRDPFNFSLNGNDLFKDQSKFLDSTLKCSILDSASNTSSSD